MSKKKLDENLKWEDVKEQVLPLLISTESHKKVAEALARSFFNMTIVYATEMPNEKDQLNLLNAKCLTAWGINIETVHRQALQNLKGQGAQYQLQSLDDIVKELTDEYTLPPLDSCPFLYVLTNKEKMFGAAAILNLDLLKELSGGRGFYILPSSIHETMFFWEKEMITQTDLDCLVQEINENIIPPWEQLASHTVYYDAQNNEIRSRKESEPAYQGVSDIGFSRRTPPILAGGAE